MGWILQNQYKWGTESQFLDYLRRKLPIIPGAGAVSTVFGRSGAVVAATNDYTFAQIGSKPTTVAGYGITNAALNTFSINTNAPLTGGSVTLGSAGEVFITLGLDNSQPQTWNNVWGYQLNGIGNTFTAGGIYQNITASTAGVQRQVSPGILFVGSGWKTTATAASQPVQFQLFVQPVPGTTAPTGLFRIQSSINNVTFTDALNITNDGKLILTSSVLGTIANGTLEYDGTHLYFSIGGVRNTLI